MRDDLTEVTSKLKDIEKTLLLQNKHMMMLNIEARSIVRLLEKMVGNNPNPMIKPVKKEYE